MKQIILIACISILILGCSKSNKNWLIGDWQIDTQTSIQENPKNLLTSLAMDKMKDATVRINKNQITTTSSGKETVSEYRIINHDVFDTIVIEDEKKNTTTYHKEGDRIWTMTEGGLHIKIYLKPASN